MNEYSKPRLSLGLSLALAPAALPSMPAAASQPVNLLEPKRPHRPDLDRVRKADEKRLRKAAARMRRS